MATYKPYNSVSDEEGSHSPLIITNTARGSSSDDESLSSRRRQRNRQRTSASSGSSGWHSMDEYADYAVSRDEAMIEGTRMLIDSLKEKVVGLENKCDKLEREKIAVGELLGVRKREYLEQEEDFEREMNAFEDKSRLLESENRRLVERLKLPESERFSFKDSENEITELERLLHATETKCGTIDDDNYILKQEISELKLEMDEMHDQFREDEAIEFREIQKDLEATAKNCRILQFKLRKAERKNDQVEADRLQYEEKIRIMESRFECSDDKQHIRELEEELKMAKEVSVRLHDELENVGEMRNQYDEEVSRLQDYVTESENGRLLLQKETQQLHNEVDRLQEKLSSNRKLKNGTSPELPIKKDSVKKFSDMQHLMRELTDSLERENDVKEQFRFAEEEIRMMRKKVSEVEEENESLDAQLHKMASAKSGRYTANRKSDEIITEREHDLRIEMELAEEEVKILKRKNDDLEHDNDKLLKEIEFLQDMLLKRTLGDSGALDIQPGVDERTDEEKIQAMAMDIDELKWKLMEKDRIAERLARKERDVKSGRGFLQKSRSLDSEQSLDIRKQLDLVQQEAALLRERISRLETENDKLCTENKRLQIIAARKGLTISAKEILAQNTGLQERIRDLETENNSLERRVAMLSAIPPPPAHDACAPGSDVTKQLRLAGDENVSLRNKMAAAEDEAVRLRLELKRFEGENKTAMEEQLALELRDKIKDLEHEIKNLMTIVKSREEENERLEEEIDEYRQDIDKMMDVFRSRETDMMEEIESVHQKNNVLNNLLDLVTERAETTQKELERFTHDTNITSSRSDRSASVVSAISDVSVGSDEVFLSTSAESRDRERKGINKDWEDQFLKRINCLERLLVEERLKVHAAEKRETFKDVASSIIMEDNGLHAREKDILQKELALCQRQLTEATEQIGELKDRLDQFEDMHDVIKNDFERVCSELDLERTKKGDQSPGTPGTPPSGKLGRANRSSSLGALSGREPASWRWEKQEYERQLRDMRKKTDELHRQLQRAQIKWKMAGGDEKAKTDRERVERNLKLSKEECAKYKEDICELKQNIKQIQDTLASKQNQWDAERNILEMDRRAAVKEAAQKGEVVKHKDDIIQQKDELIKHKENVISEQQSSVDKAETEAKKKKVPTATLR